MLYRNLFTREEVKGIIIGMISSITASVITLYIAQRYIVERASTQAAAKAIEDYKRQYGIMSPSLTKWTPLSYDELQEMDIYVR